MKLSWNHIFLALTAMLLQGCVDGLESGVRQERVAACEMRKAYAHLLTQYVSDDGNREIYCAKDVDEARSLFDVGIAPTFEDKKPLRVEGLRREIVDGRSWMYVSDDGKYRTFYFVNLYPSKVSDYYGFYCYVGNYDSDNGRFDPVGVNSDFLKLRFDEEDRPSRSVRPYEESVNRLPRLKEDFDCRTDDVDAVVIVDVLDVQLVEVSGFERAGRYSGGFENADCTAVYDVVVDVRKIEKGGLASDWYVIEVPCKWSDLLYQGSFLYYRGMTLRIGLKRQDQLWVICEELPVLPYPPYSGTDVKLSGGCLTGDDFSAKEKGRLSPLVVEYDRHTKVEYSSGGVVCHGRYGTFSDFGVASKVKVLEVKEGGDKSFWEHAWFMQEDGDYDPCRSGSGDNSGVDTSGEARQD